MAELLTAAEWQARFESRPISIEIEIDTLMTLDVSEVWPDGDAPTEITAEAVKAQMEGRSADRVISDWNIPVELVIRVDRPNPHWSPSPPLIPELAPKARIITTATVR